MEQVTNGVFVWVVTGLLGCIVGLLAAFVRSEHALRKGMRSLLRNELVKAHRVFVVERDPVSLVDREVVDRNYQAYHSLGGNGTGTKLYEEIMDVPITE